MPVSEYVRLTSTMFWYRKAYLHTGKKKACSVERKKNSEPLFLRYILFLMKY